MNDNPEISYSDSDLRSEPKAMVKEEILTNDWSNREYIESIAAVLRKITKNLNAFDKSCRSKIAVLIEKLDYMERRIEYLEERIGENPENGTSENISHDHLEVPQEKDEIKDEINEQINEEL